MKHMEQHYMNAIALDDLAELTGTNKFHLSKEFKRYTGFSPHDYLIWLRINQAKILLKTTTLPASKISHQVGIHDIGRCWRNIIKSWALKTAPMRNSIGAAFIELAH